MAKTFPLRLSDELRAEIDRDVERIRKDNPKFSLNDWMIGAAKRQLAFADLATFPVYVNPFGSGIAVDEVGRAGLKADPQHVTASPKPKRSKLPKVAKVVLKRGKVAVQPVCLPLSDLMRWRREHGV